MPSALSPSANALVDEKPTAQRTRLLPSPPQDTHARKEATPPVVIVPHRAHTHPSGGALPTRVGRKSSLRWRGRRQGEAKEGAEEAVLPTGSPSEDEGGEPAAPRQGLALLRQLPAALSSTSLISQAETFQSTGTNETSDGGSAAPPERTGARAIPIRPRLGRRRSSTGSIHEGAAHAELVLSTSLPVPARQHSSFALAFAAPFSNLVAIPDSAAKSRTIDFDTAERVALSPPPRPLRSVSTTIVHSAPATVLKRKASVTTRGRYGGETTEVPLVSSRTPRAPRRPATATGEGGFSRPFVVNNSVLDAYPSYNAASYLPASTSAAIPVPATVSFDSASSASSSVDALPRAPPARHCRGKSDARARSKSKQNVRAESLTTSASAASASETDSGSGSGSKTGTIRSGLLKLKKSTANLRNAFRPSKLDIPPLPTSTSTLASSGAAMPLSPVSTATTQPSLVSSLAGIAVDHDTLDSERLSPTTPTPRAFAVPPRPAIPPPVPPLRSGAKAEGLRRTRSRPRQHRPSTAIAAGSRDPAPGHGVTSLRRAASTSVLRADAGAGTGKPSRPEPPTRDLVRRVEEWARESGS